MYVEKERKGKKKKHSDNIRKVGKKEMERKRMNE